MQKIYAGIGSRETPTAALNQMWGIANALAKEGWKLRSGNADGADTAFDLGCIAGNGTKEIYLPWEHFNGKSSMDKDYQAIDGLSNYEEAMEIAEKFHPKWDACSAGAKKLHTRNVYQIVGMNLNTKLDMVICWTIDGKRQGGTGQALRIAEYLEIPIFDLALDVIGSLNEFVNKPMYNKSSTN